jgi:membrane protease YdiL (CAAX protease family)
VSPTPTPPGLTAPALPPRANAARLVLYIGAPLAFLTVLAFAGTDGRLAVALLAPAIVAAAALVFVGTRVARDHDAAPEITTGSTVRRMSRWDWTDVLAFVPATVAIIALTSTILVGGTKAVDGSLTATARTAVESFADQAAFYAAAVVALGVLLVARRGLSVRDLGWRLPRPLGRAGRLPWLVIAVVAAVVALYVASELGSLAQQLLPNSPNTQCTSVRGEYGGYVAVAIPLVCIVAPVAEESIFRGFFYGWLRRHLPVLPAVVVCAAVFSASHAVLVLALPLFAVGVILALLYEYSASLIPGAVVHGLFNLVGILAILGTTTSC